MHTVIILGLEKDFRLQIDQQCLMVGPKFRGVHSIPSGLHYFSIYPKSDEDISVFHTGYFHYFNENKDGTIEVLEWKNDQLIPRLDLNNDQKQNMFKEFQAFICPLPKDGKWELITKYLKLRDLEMLKIQPDWVLVDSMMTLDKIMTPLKFDLKHSFPKGAPAEQITQYSLDKSWLLSKLFADYSSKSETLILVQRVLAEFSFCFLMFYSCFNFDYFEHYQNLLQLFSKSTQNLVSNHLKFYSSFLPLFLLHLEWMLQNTQWLEIFDSDPVLKDSLRDLLGRSMENSDIKIYAKKANDLLKTSLHWDAIDAYIKEEKRLDDLDYQENLLAGK